MIEYDTQGAQRILCVQPDEKARSLVRESLRDFSLVIVGTAAEAIRCLNKRPFDAYVLEQYMVDWVGHQLCRAIRLNDPHVPIVILTNARDETIRMRCLRAGANDFLIRHSVDSEGLLGLLRNLLAAADLENLRARIGAELAIHKELTRRMELIHAQGMHVKALHGESAARITQARALEVFVTAGGTRSHFEGWWRQVFDDCWKNMIDASDAGSAQQDGSGTRRPKPAEPPRLVQALSGVQR
jgi:DNA-binding response OmpR family regulator